MTLFSMRLLVLIFGCLLSSGAHAQAPQKLEQKDIDILIKRIRYCWDVPPSNRGTTIEMRIKLKPDGTLNGTPEILSEPEDEHAKLVGDSAVSALQRCQPYKLPAASYPYWKEIDAVFNTWDLEPEKTP